MTGTRQKGASERNLTLDEAVQGATSNAERSAERIVERVEPKTSGGRSLKVAGQIAIGFFLPWIGSRDY